MKKIIPVIFLSFISLLVYQNCGQSKSTSAATGGSETLESVYPYYSAKPEFFDNVQLVKADLQTDNTVKLSFSATISFAEDPEQIVDVEYQVTNDTGGIVCPRMTGRVNRSNNDIELTDCIAVKQPKYINVAVRAKLKAETQLRAVSNYKFSF